VNYAVETAQIRQARDARLAALASALSEVRRTFGVATVIEAEARAELRALREARDSEIFRLRETDPPVSLQSIAVGVGCSKKVVLEVLNPDRSVELNRRRREYWHVYATRRRAA
jgi:hypothetical protein